MMRIILAERPKSIMIIIVFVRQQGSLLFATVADFFAPAG